MKEYGHRAYVTVGDRQQEKRFKIEPGVYDRIKDWQTRPVTHSAEATRLRRTPFAPTRSDA